MNERTTRGTDRRYWLLVLLAVIVISPPAVIGFGAVVAALTGELAIRALRRSAARPAPLREPGSEAVLLGSDAGGERVLLSDRQLSAHGLILGASGAGKSTTLLRILTDYVRRGRPVVAIDLKGSPSFERELAAAAATAGRRFALWTPDGPGRWNPLGHGNATELKDKLIATERFTEPHYQRAAERYVQTVLQVLLVAHPEQPPTLDEVVGLMDPRRMPGMLRQVPRPLAERVQDYLSGLAPDQTSAIRGLGTRLAILSESHTGRFLNGGGEHAIDLRAALAGSDVVLFSLNSSTYGKSAAQIGTLAVQDLISAVGDRLTQGGAGRFGPALIGLDEFSALGADNVIALLARGREAGISVLLATQELADLDRAARGLRDQVLGNTAVKIAHRQDVPASAQTIAQLVGTETTWEHTYQTSAGALLARHDTGRGTRRQVERFVVHPNAIKSLPTGHAVLITRVPEANARTVRVIAPHEAGRGHGTPPARGLERE